MSVWESMCNESKGCKHGMLHQAMQGKLRRVGEQATTLSRIWQRTQIVDQSCVALPPQQLHP